MCDVEIPKHIGFIVDGNRRWAKQNGLSAYEGHIAGYDKIKGIASIIFDEGVKYASIYAFSTENWKRSEEEVSGLMGLLIRFLKADLNEIGDKNIRIKILGSRDKLSPEIIKAIDQAESKTVNNTAGTLAICFNYGGQLEIADAVKKIIDSGIASSDITPELIGQNLYASDIPPVDIVVRTSGEKRLSNFMLWRTAYSEIMFIDRMWPDMTKQDIRVIIDEYNKRSRRFGG